jgi:hypothetical protein
MALYCFAVMDRQVAIPKSIKGIGQAPVRPVPLNGLAVVVNEVEPNQPMGASALRRHLAVVDKLFAAGPLLPFRFGVVVEDESALREQLLERGDDLAGALERLRGRREFNVTVRFDESQVLRSMVAEQPGLRELSAASRDSGAFAPTIQLGEAVYQELEHRKEAEAAAIVERLSPSAEAVAPRPATGDAVMRTAVLVSDAARPDFERTLSEMAGERPWLLIDCVGPMPPYSFVDLG